MITALLSSFLHPRCAAAHVTALVGLAGLATFSSAQAFVPSVETDGVITGDTFSIEMVGYNTTATASNIYIIQTNLNPTFGTTQTFANDALGGQTLTVTSSQTGTTTNFVDTITISVPTNFVPAGTTDNAGNIINGIVFSIGSYNIPTGGTANPLDFNTSLTSAKYSGSVQGTMTVSTSLAGSQNPVLTNNNMSLSNEEGIQTFVTGTTTPRDISTNGINQFTFTVSVPEPSTYATVLLGAAGLCWLTVARRRARA